MRKLAREKGPQRGTPEWMAAVLAYDFDADSKDSYVEHRFSDVVAVARKVGPCALCFGPVTPGELSRRETVKIDGEVRTARYCLACCDAMAVWPEHAEHMEERYELGHARAVGVSA